MPPVSVLIKPASGLCNLRCEYCFYREYPESEPVMSMPVAEELIKKIFAYADGSVTIAFQGGEPTLCGVGFFENFIGLVKEYNANRLPVCYALQTNGKLVDNRFAAFFKKNRFLIGLSVDGVKAVHDSLRPGPDGGESFYSALTAAETLKKHGVDFNILTVATRQLSTKIEEVYAFYKKMRFFFQQYIPCLTPLGRDPADFSFAPAAEEYGKFLSTLFSLWHSDWKNGVYVSDRYFDNLAGLLLGRPAELCTMHGVCSNQLVFEADGACYPCDFYVDGAHLLGSIAKESISGLLSCKASQEFTRPVGLANQCRACRYFQLCRSGCRREWDTSGKTRFCAGLLSFFDFAVPKLLEVCRDIRSGRAPRAPG